MYKYALILFSLVTFLTLSASAEQTKPITIGMSAAFSGQSENLGTDLYKGIMTYFNYINAQGGVNGRKLVLKTYDDGYNPVPALNNTLRLMKHDNVLLLFSYVGTPTVTRVLPLLKLNKKENFYLFFPFTGAEPQRQFPYKEFVYNLRPSYGQETEGLVDNFIKIGKKRIAVFYQADAYGRSGWDGVRKALDKHGLQIISEATYKRGSDFADSYKSQIDILKSSQPDAVISIGSYAACAGFIRYARNSGWNIPIANLSFVGSESLLQLLIKETNRNTMDYTTDLINSEVVPNYNDTNIAAVKEYRELSSKYTQDTSGDKLSFVGLEGFLNAKLIVKILTVMDDNVSRNNIKEKTESISDYDIGLEDKISFSNNKHQALDRVYYNTVRDGKWVSITDWNIIK